MRKFLTRQAVKYYIKHYNGLSHNRFEPFPNEYEFEKRMDVLKFWKFWILSRWQFVKFWMWLSLLNENHKYFGLHISETIKAFKKNA